MIGVDEVGRGCWAGPLVAGAVSLPTGLLIEDLTDSKLLTSQQRAGLSDIIYQVAGWTGLGWVWPEEIDDWGLTKAVAVAMQRATICAAANSLIIIDGNYNFLPQFSRAKPVVKADFSVPAVAAASIIAKVARDNFMQGLAETQFPQFGFASHVGYGTAQHRLALSRYGPNWLHRKSYKPVAALL